MGEDTLLEFPCPIEDKMQGIIKVIGVGGGGCNAVRNMNDEQIPGVTFAVCNTDSKSLAPSPVPVKILDRGTVPCHNDMEIQRYNRQINNISSVSLWQTNKVQPSVEQLYEIARHLDVDVKELLVSSK